GPELWPELHAELERLPEKYRTPLVLCYLEGLSHELAARQLRWPLGTLKTRLRRGRERLRQQLTQRGLALCPGALAVALSQSATAAPATLVESTVQAAQLVAAGKTVAGGTISTQAAALMEGVLQAMFVNKLKVLLVVFLAVGLAGALVGFL